MAGERGLELIQDAHLLEKLAHFDRERIPERVVHAKGAGAYGYFEVTADVTRYTKAKFLSEVGRKTGRTLTRSGTFSPLPPSRFTRLPSYFPSGVASKLSQHERLQQPHLQMVQHQRGVLLGAISPEDRSGDQKPDAGRSVTNGWRGPESRYS
jgi:hypothetical protein